MASELARIPFLLEALHPSDSCSSLPSSRMVLSLSIVEAETSSPISWIDLRGLPPLRVRTLCTMTCGRLFSASLAVSEVKGLGLACLLALLLPPIHRRYRVYPRIQTVSLVILLLLLPWPSPSPSPTPSPSMEPLVYGFPACLRGKVCGFLAFFC